MDAIPVEEELCVLPAGVDAVQRDELNLLIRRVSAYHLRPMKLQLSETDKSLKEHIESCALNQAKIMGALTVIKWLSATGLGGAAIAGLSMWAQHMGWI